MLFLFSIIVSLNGLLWEQPHSTFKNCCTRTKKQKQMRLFINCDVKRMYVDAFVNVFPLNCITYRYLFCITDSAEKVATVNAEVTIQNMQYSDALADKDSTEYNNFTIVFCDEVKITHL